MAIKIKDDIKEKIGEFISDNLHNVHVDNGSFVNSRSMYSLFEVDRIIDNKQASKELAQIVGDNPLYHFVSETINRDVRNTQDYESGKDVSIVELAPFSDPAAYAAKIIQDLKSLPWSYTFTLRLPKDLHSLLDNAKSEAVISTSMRLIRVTPEFARQFPLESKVERRNEVGGILGMTILGHSKPEWTEGEVVLQLQEKGFVGEYDYSVPTRQAESKVRSFLGVLLALFAIKKTSSFMFHPPKRDFLIHKFYDKGWNIERKYELDDDFNKLLAKFAIQDFDGNEALEKNKQVWVNHCLSMASAAFRPGEDAERLRLAARWLFDSYATDRDLLAFVQAMVAMEILLGHGGDIQEIGIGTVIRNRCAYLIAANAEDREKITSDIKEIYKIRSNIVHTGKEHLSVNEFGMLSILRSYCARVILKEIELSRG